MKQKLKEKVLPPILVVSNQIVRERWWLDTHLKAIRPGEKVLVHKNQSFVKNNYIRIRYGKKKSSIVVLSSQYFKTINGKEFKA